ncbi:hypothetical protein HAX54_041446, partial [Datura stramonium]|nr:hypothetical protein [Datura stramonium]
MNGFIFITLRLYHGGDLLFDGKELRYESGVMSEYVNVDVDTISYLEIKDYIKELGLAAPSTANPSDPVITPSNSKDDDFPVNRSDESTNSSSNSENSNLIGIDDYDSDVHEEYIETGVRE